MRSRPKESSAGVLDLPPLAEGEPEEGISVLPAAVASSGSTPAPRRLRTSSRTSSSLRLRFMST